MHNLSESFKNHRLYSEFIQVKSRLKAHNFICWIAGGAVRDLYLGKSDIYDFDLVTDAHTENLKQIFPEALLVGEKFGVLKVSLGHGDFFDLATFRQESDYQDGRRPSMVTSSTPSMDAFRRDFKMNALFWDDENKKLIDYVGGVFDLEQKIITCVGDADVRFQEDYLRIVRLIRFKAQLGFSIEAATRKSALEKVSLVKKISAERIWSELKKIEKTENLKCLMTEPLFIHLLADLFEIKDTDDITKRFLNLDLSAVSSTFQDAEPCSLNCGLDLLYVLINLSDDKSAIRETLIRVLRPSRNEVALFDLLQFALEDIQKLSKAELCYHIEKKKNLLDVLEYLARKKEQTIINLNLGYIAECRAILQKYIDPLVVGSDLVEKIKPTDIKEALFLSRVWQFEGLVTSKENCIERILKMFSNKI